MLARLMLFPKNILDFMVYSQWGKKGEQAMVYMLMEGPKSWLYECLEIIVECNLYSVVFQDVTTKNS